MKVEFKVRGVKCTLVAGIISMTRFSTFNSISQRKGYVSLHVIGVRVPFISACLILNYDFGVRAYNSPKHDKFNPQIR